MRVKRIHTGGFAGQACAAAILAVLFLVLGAMGQPAVEASTIHYRIVDLGSLGGSNSYAYDINNNAELAGKTTTGSNAAGVWFHWRSQVMRGASESPLLSSATALNDIGHVVGFIGATDGSSSAAFAYDTRRFKILRGLGGTCDRANDVSNKDYEVGVSYLAGNCHTGTRYHAVIWRDRTPHSLGSLVGPGGNSAATALNYKEMITGVSDSSAGHMHSFFWRAGKMWDMGVLPGAVSSEGLDINPVGDVVGKSTYAGGSYHAFFKGRKARTMIDIGTLGGDDSVAYGIGRSDEVVGSADTSGDTMHAFIWANGTITDLNSLVPAGSGWVLEAATAMNDYGRISGWGTFGGATQGFMLVPQP